MTVLLRVGAPPVRHAALAVGPAVEVLVALRLVRVPVGPEAVRAARAIVAGRSGVPASGALVDVPTVGERLVLVVAEGVPEPDEAAVRVAQPRLAAAGPAALWIGTDVRSIELVPSAPPASGRRAVTPARVDRAVGRTPVDGVILAGSAMALVPGGRPEVRRATVRTVPVTGGRRERAALAHDATNEVTVAATEGPGVTRGTVTVRVGQGGAETRVAGPTVTTVHRAPLARSSGGASAARARRG